MIHIVIHILPQEIDQLEQLLIQLKRNSVHLPKNHGMHVAVEMNCKLVDWDKSKIPQEYFFKKFHRLKGLTLSWASVWFMGDQYNGKNYHEGHRTSSQGCNDARRRAVKYPNCPYIMYLDADNVFGEYFLINMYNSCINLMSMDNIIITPQTTRMWDSTWDVITNYRHLDEEASHAAYDVRDPYESINLPLDNDVYLKTIHGFKFAGWGTTISAKLAQFIGIPTSLGSYGLDDTFIMFACQIMKDKGYLVQQYVLCNEVIIENNKFRFNSYKDYLVIIDKREEFLAQAHANFNPELEKFKSRI